MLTPAIVPHAQLRALVNCMLQPDPAHRHLASLLLSTFPDVPTPLHVPAKKEEGGKGSTLAPSPSPEFKADIRIGSCISIHSVLGHGVLKFHKRDSHLSVTVSDIHSGAAPAQLDGRRSWERIQLRHAPNGCFALYSIEHGALLAMDAQGAVTAQKLQDLHVAAEQLDDLSGRRALPNACRWRFVDAGQGRFALHNSKANRFLRITDRGDVDGFGGPTQAHELPADRMFERFWVLPHPLPPAMARDRDVGGDERQVYHNGYNYRTWHGHLPASLTFVDESCKFDAFPPGWEPSPRDADSMRVCAQHAWGVNALVLNDMFPVCTAGGPHHNPTWTPGSVLQQMRYHHDKQGNKISIDTDVVTFGAKWCVDVLLRQRVEGAVHTAPAPAATGSVSADRKQLVTMHRPTNFALAPFFCHS
jgi:hypothetical protein